MNRVVLFLIVALSACGIPEVDLDLPNRPSSQVEESQTSPAAPVSSEGSEQATPSDPADQSGSPAIDELSELEQLVSEIETLLEGVADDLDEISFDEES